MVFFCTYDFVVLLSILFFFCVVVCLDINDDGENVYATIILFLHKQENEAYYLSAFLPFVVMKVELV